MTNNMTNQNLISASSLSGKDVQNAKGDNLGNVKEIMLDIENNHIVYYVLSFGGLFGLGDKLFAIPPEAMKLCSESDHFILDIDKERLKEAEGFDKDNWPNMSDPTFRGNLYKHYGISDRFTA